MATSRSEIMSDEIFGIKCCFCAADNRTREADTYCVDCKDYYCSPCAETHKKVSATKGHTLLDKANFKSQGSEDSLQSIPTQRCSQHPTEVINMFCKDHNEVACAPCIAFTHRTCTNIHFIPDEVDNLYQRKELADMKQKLNTMKKSMQEIKTAKEKKVEELQVDFDQEVKSVKAFGQELRTLLDKLEQDTIKELKQEFTTIKSSLTSDIQEANNLLDDLNDTLALLKKSEGNKSQEFVGIKSAEKVTAKAEQAEKELIGKTEESVSFTANENIKSFLKQIQSFGKVSSNSKNSPDNINQGGQAEVKHKDDSSNTQCSIYGKDGLYKVKRSKEIDVKLTNDSSVCRIVGSCISEDGGVLLLTDYGNKKLKRLDMSTEKVKDYIDLNDRPIAICLISRTEAAVTLYNKESLQFVSLGNKLTTTRILTMSHPGWGLAYKDGKLFISGSNNTVYIHDMNGQELKKISTDASQKQIFQQSLHITFSADEDKVFVANNKDLVILDIHGNYLSTLTLPTVLHATGVCTDGKNLFVSDRTSNNIVQIGQDYKLLGELVKFTSNPYSLYFDPHKTRLIATCDNNSKITVLELE